MNPELQSLEANLLDREWRLNNLYLILDETGAMIPLEMRGEQRKFLAARHNRNFIPKPRKLGMSSIIVLSNGDECLFTPDFTAGIIDLAEKDAFDKLQIFRFAWENGIFHPRPEIRTLWKLIHEVNPLKSDSARRMEWKNGSSYQAGTSYVGKTPQRLHVSEYGPISAQHPKKATSIKRGSINAVPPDGIIDIETTMEGGRFGECYQLFQLALSSEGKPLTKLDWRNHFFSWLNHPSYDLPGHVPSRADTTEYFAMIEGKTGRKVPESKQAWYEKKKQEQGEDIYQQFPTIIEECDRQIVPGQIYPEMKTVRAEGRVRAFNPEKGRPFFTAWDLGSSDNMAGWLIQPAGKDHNFLDWCCGEGAGAAGVAGVIREWEYRHGSIHMHLIPHDAKITDKGSGKTYLDQLIECGIPRGRIVVVPRIPDLWVGIDEVRKILPNAWFHARTDIPIASDTGAKLPGGVGRLEGYRKKPDASTGNMRDVPVHDLCSHTCDAARTYAEALSRDLVQTNVGPRHSGGARVITGFRGEALNMVAAATGNARVKR
jgi:hypothetical protein